MALVDLKLNLTLFLTASVPKCSQTPTHPIPRFLTPVLKQRFFFQTTDYFSHMQQMCEEKYC